MKKLYVHGDYIIFDNKKYRLDDMYTKDYYQYINSIAEKYESENIYDNILFSILIQDYLAIQFFVIENSIDEVVIKKSSNTDLVALILDVCKNNGKKITVASSRSHYYKFSSYIICFASFIYLLLLQLKTNQREKKFSLEKDFCVLRTVAAKKKIKSNDHLEIFTEDKPGEGDFYNYLKRSERLIDCVRAYIKANGLLRNLSKTLIKYGIKESAYIAFRHFSKRFVHACFYEISLSKLMSYGWKGRFISADNLDMFAIIQERVAHTYNIHTVCIPHGIEYGYKFPHCFSGDIFYTTTQYTAAHLNKLYKTNKFIFDDKIAEGMFKVRDLREVNGNIVFFSEPREPEVNIQILGELVPKLEKQGIKLFIKHHPKDDIKDYKSFHGKVEIINDFNQAISGNICIARKSTALVEARYNNSLSFSILICEKDKNTFSVFPSLQDIEHFDNINDLVNKVIMARDELKEGAF